MNHRTHFALLAIIAGTLGLGCMAGADSAEGGNKRRNLPGFNREDMDEEATTYNGISCGTTRWGIKIGTDGVTTSQMSFGPGGALDETNAAGAAAGGWGYLTVADINAYTNPYGPCAGSGPWGTPARTGFSSGGCFQNTNSSLPDTYDVNANYINGTSSCTSASQCVKSGGGIMVTNGDVTCEADPARGGAKYCRYWSETSQFKIQNVTMVQYEVDDGDQDVHAIMSTNANLACWSSICWDKSVAGTYSCTTTGANSPDCAGQGAATACVREGTATPASYRCRVPLSGNTFIAEIADSANCEYKYLNPSDVAGATPYAATSIFRNASIATRNWFFSTGGTGTRPWPVPTTSWTYGAWTVSLRGVLFGDFGHGANGSSTPAFELHPVLGMCSGVDCMKDATKDATKSARASGGSGGGGGSSGVPANGNFDAATWNSSWTTSGTVAAVAHTPGVNAMKMCGTDNCTAEAKQTVTIPAGGTPTLSYTTQITTAETGTTVYDKLLVRASTNGGSTWTTLATLSNVAPYPSSTYVTRTIDLAAYKGTSLTLDFLATTDTSLSTTFNVDDIVITGLGTGACTPSTCAGLGKNCGSVSDGCGGTLSCGTCSTGYTCSASNVCTSSCTPSTCASLGKNCGSVSDGCGGTLSCGSCSTGYTCSASNVCTASGSCGSTQLAANGGFESGSTSWTLAGSGSGATTTGIVDTSAPRSGVKEAWLCGYGTTGTQSLLQTITIPASSCTATLSFWVKIATNETTTTTAYDTLKVQIRNTAGTVLATPFTLSNLNASASYVQKTYDISAYKGQTVQVYFLGSEDSSSATSFYIDDVSLTE